MEAEPEAELEALAEPEAAAVVAEPEPAAVVAEPEAAAVVAEPEPEPSPPEPAAEAEVGPEPALDPAPRGFWARLFRRAPAPVEPAAIAVEPEPTAPEPEPEPEPAPDRSFATIEWEALPPRCRSRRHLFRRSTATRPTPC